MTILVWKLFLLLFFFFLFVWLSSSVSRAGLGKMSVWEGRNPTGFPKHVNTRAGAQIRKHQEDLQSLQSFCLFLFLFLLEKKTMSNADRIALLLLVLVHSAFFFFFFFPRRRRSLFCGLCRSAVGSQVPFFISLH